MTSVFRRRIASQVVSTLKPFLKGNEKVHLYEMIPLLLKFRQPKCLSPQFELSWKDTLVLKPDLKERVHPATVLTYLKNQDFPTSEGITDVFLDSVSQDRMIFTFEQEIFTSSVLLDICSRIDNMPSKSSFFKNIPPENVIVEYSSPNIAKPFHYGHFRSTVLGNFLSNIFKYVGHSVTQMNYVGDWGLQYGILAVGFNKFGSEEKLKCNPLGHLLEVYKEANARSTSDPDFNQEAKLYFKKMEEGDNQCLELWKKLRELSLDAIQATYKRLNVCFDEIHGESMFVEDTKNMWDELLSKKVAASNENGCIETTITTENNQEEKVILRKNDGTSLYLTRDIAAAVHRKQKFHFDSMYYVVDSSQAKHFRHLKSILNMLDYNWSSNIHHVPYGRVLNFSTRKGNAVFLHDILDEAKSRTLENMKKSSNTKVSDNMDEVADVLGISSLIINDFRTRRRKESEFSWERTLNMKADSGNSLQYCHARLNSIKENCGVELCTDCELLSLVEPEAISLIEHLAKFEEVIYNTYTELEPCILVQYLFSLRNEIGKAIKVLPVKGSNIYVARARLLLFHASQLVLQKSLQLVGITPLNKM
ncbi:probable arginine--tRNA ligase, mitochondrial isoform X2 [Uloborus diversus]|uniref:probable arginine--tRNA ligase, mitochondrial isoform X1 n=1 Tax=Uloborus diversus TaxID=327109 RepID=UPI00240A3A6E|nr:probable arginine--tRNA ligase, mitochondrial isoform X1 [Uloborus diversus]XP_054718019.1 probable arginine--tRNA ligase, mitochondrial isoform X2 [Uloborus diversus]